MAKTVVTGEEFKKLQRKAKRLGAKSLDLSNRKNNKYVVEYDGKKIHCGSIKYGDFLIHKDKVRRDKYLARAKKIEINRVNLHLKTLIQLIIGRFDFYGLKEFFYIYSSY